MRAGKIRYAGVSNFTAEQLKRLQRIHPVASLQPPYSLLRREVERKLLPYCAANGIGVVVYSPMQMGLLTGRFSRERVAALPADDLRARNPWFAEPQLGWNLELVEKLRPVAARAGHSLAELAVAWVLRRPEVTAAIVGGRRPDQVEEPARAAGWELAPEVEREVERLLAEREAKSGPPASPRVRPAARPPLSRAPRAPSRRLLGLPRPVEQAAGGQDLPLARRHLQPGEDPPAADLHRHLPGFPFRSLRTSGMRTRSPWRTAS